MIFMSRVMREERLLAAQVYVLQVDYVRMHYIESCSMLMFRKLSTTFVEIAKVLDTQNRIWVRLQDTITCAMTAMVSHSVY